MKKPLVWFQMTWGITVLRSLSITLDSSNMSQVTAHMASFLSVVDMLDSLQIVMNFNIEYRSPLGRVNCAYQGGFLRFGDKNGQGNDL